MKIKNIILLGALGLLILIALSFGLGWTNVFYTKTVGKAQQNAERSVFEQTQSYVEAKRQELIKLHHEWILANESDKIAIESIVRQSFANFDDSKIIDPELRNFLRNIKYH
jgi:uncharacterized protein (DUF4213/DUF364 family)